MKSWYNNNDCEHLRAYRANYSVSAAAMLWCGVPYDDLQEELDRVVQHPYVREVFVHPRIRCFEVRCKIIHDAIESRALPAMRENGKVTDDYIAPDRRHVSREHLKAWIAKEFPADKPAFLFDEIERNNHAAISADAFRVLQADLDAVRAELEKAKERASEAIRESGAMRSERDTLRAMVEKANAPGGRYATIDRPLTTRQRRTMLTVIAAMCQYEGLVPQARGTAQRIMEMTDDLGAHVDDGTIAKMLAEIPDALETRMK